MRLFLLKYLPVKTTERNNEASLPEQACSNQTVFPVEREFAHISAENQRRLVITGLDDREEDDTQRGRGHREAEDAEVVEEQRDR